MRGGSLRMSTKKNKNRRRRVKPPKLKAHSSSIEEVFMPTSFSEVLKNKTLRGKFRDFLDKRVAVECLNFYEAIEFFEQITVDSARQKAGRHIIEQYIAENARYWVNIPGTLRAELLILEEFVSDSFATAKLAVEDLMSVNFFEEFKKKLKNNNAKCNAPTLSFENKHVYRESSFEDLSQQFSSDILSVKSKEEDDFVPPPAESFSKRGKGRLAGSMRSTKRNSVTVKKGKLSASSQFNSSRTLFRIGGRKKSRTPVKGVLNEPKRPDHLNTDIWKEVENENEVSFSLNF